MFLATFIEHVRFRVRAKMCAASGADVLLIGFTRSHYPGGKTTVPTVELGSIAHRKYLSRPFRLFRGLGRLRQESKNYQVIYCFGLDALVLGLLSTVFKNRQIVYEVGDIREVFIGTSLRARLWRACERFLLRFVDLVVVTSEAYFTAHFQAHHGLERQRVMVIENKLTADAQPVDREPESDTITIGYFGVLRCSRSWEILTEAVAQADGRLRLYVRGVPVGIPTFEEDIARSKWISYGGPYRVPEDQVQLYSSVDIVWAAYPYGGEEVGNWQWARTVRFYEAGAHGKPVIVQAGTVDAEVVIEQKIGMAVSMQDVRVAADALNTMTHADIAEWRERVRQMPRRAFYECGEHAELLEILDRDVGAAKGGSN
jgi:succinoglycan biosynthesis protein ExoL